MIGREKELSFIIKGFTKGGLLRSSILLGPEGMGKTNFLDEIKSAFLSEELKSLVIAPSPCDAKDLPSVVSSMVRHMSAGADMKKSQIGKFARFLGTQIIQIETALREDGDIDKFGKQLAKTLVTGIEDTIIHSGIDLKQVKPLLIIDDLDKLDTTVRDWLSGPFNKEIRKSSGY